MNPGDPASSLSLWLTSPWFCVRGQSNPLCPAWHNFLHSWHHFSRNSSLFLMHHYLFFSLLIYYKQSMVFHPTLKMSFKKNLFNYYSFPLLSPWAKLHCIQFLSSCCLSDTRHPQFHCATSTGTASLLPEQLTPLLSFYFMGYSLLFWLFLSIGTVNGGESRAQPSHIFLSLAPYLSVIF